MTGPLVMLEGLRRNVQKMPAGDKRRFHDAKKELEAVIKSHGKMGELAALELTLAAAVKRGDS